VVAHFEGSEIVSKRINNRSLMGFGHDQDSVSKVKSLSRLTPDDLLQ